MRLNPFHSRRLKAACEAAFAFDDRIKRCRLPRVRVALCCTTPQGFAAVEIIGLA